MCSALKFSITYFIYYNYITINLFSTLHNHFFPSVSTVDNEHGWRCRTFCNREEIYLLICVYIIIAVFFGSLITCDTDRCG